MSKKEPPSQDAFDKLLAWLDPDRDKAGEKYERIFFRIVRTYAAKGCWDAEDIADETANVVASRIDELIATYKGDPALYFYGVAKNIYLEWLKKNKVPPPPPIINNIDIEKRCHCLEQCLKQLPVDEAKLVLRYYEGEKQERIANRKQMAEELGNTVNALRIRICHLLTRLRPCIEECLKHLDD
jgi:DNA-directed RNA polymerase specialized sigma24 family protein